MKLISKADLYKKSNCELARREACAAIQDIRTVQGQRRTTRPNH